MANQEGITALHLSSGNGAIECVQFLINRGADVTLQAKNGMTAMDMALKNGHEETAEILREAMKKQESWKAGSDQATDSVHP